MRLQNHHDAARVALSLLHHCGLGGVVVQLDREIDQNGGPKHGSKENRSRFVLICKEQSKVQLSTFQSTINNNARQLTWSRVFASDHGSTLHVHPQRICAEGNCYWHQQNAVHLREGVGLRKAMKKKLYSVSVALVSDDGTISYAIIAIEMEARVMDICSHAKKVRSFAKNTLGSILTGTLRGFAWG